MRARVAPHAQAPPCCAATSASRSTVAFLLRAEVDVGYEDLLGQVASLVPVVAAPAQGGRGGASRSFSFVLEGVRAIVMPAAFSSRFTFASSPFRAARELCARRDRHRRRRSTRRARGGSPAPPSQRARSTRLDVAIRGVGGAPAAPRRRCSMASREPRHTPRHLHHRRQFRPRRRRPRPAVRLCEGRHPRVGVGAAPLRVHLDPHVLVAARGRRPRERRPERALAAAGPASTPTAASRCCRRRRPSSARAPASPSRCSKNRRRRSTSSARRTANGAPAARRAPPRRRSRSCGHSSAASTSRACTASCCRCSSRRRCRPSRGLTTRPTRPTPRRASTATIRTSWCGGTRPRSG